MSENKEVFKIKRIKLSSVVIPPGLELRTDAIGSLVDSIKTVGLLNPLLVDEEMGLVSGFHRHHALMQIDPNQDVAVRVLSYSPNEIGDTIRLLSQLDENLVRFKLTSFDESKAIDKKLKLIRRLKETNPAMTEIGDTAKYLAKEMGVSVRKIYLDNQIASIEPEIINQIKDTAILNSKQSLAKIARAGGIAERNAVVNELLGNTTSKVLEISAFRKTVSEFLQLAQAIRKKFKDGSNERELSGELRKVAIFISEHPFLTEERSDGNAARNDGKGRG